MDFKKYLTKKNIIRVATGALSFAVAFTAAFLITNPRKVKSNIQSVDEPDTPIDSETYFDRFTMKLLDKLDPQAGGNGLTTKATINNLQFGLANNLLPLQATFNGDFCIDYKISGDTEFTVDLASNVLGADLNLSVGYVDDNVYLAFGDRGIKAQMSSLKQAISYISDFATLLGVEISESEEVNLDLSSLFNFDITSLALSPIEKVENGIVNVIINLELADLELNIDQNSLELLNVSINRLALGDFSLKGNLEFTSVDKVVAFDDPAYENSSATFVDTIAYLNWITKMSNVIKSEKIGFDFNAVISDANNPTNVNAIIESSLNVNIKDVFDYSHLFDDFVNSVNLDNLELSADILVKDGNKNALIGGNISYFDNAGYLAIESGEQALKAKLETSELNYVINKVIDTINKLNGDETPTKGNKNLTRGPLDEGTSGILDSLLSSGILDFILSFDFSVITDLIKNVTFTDKEAQILLDLTSFGLGDDIELSLVFDEGSSSGQTVNTLALNNLVIGGTRIDIEFSTHEYNETKIDNIKSSKSTYKDIDLTLLRYILGTVDLLDFNLLKFTTNLHISFDLDVISGDLNISPEIFVKINDGGFELFITIDDMPHVTGIMTSYSRYSQVYYNSNTGLIDIVRVYSERKQTALKTAFYQTTVDNFVANIVPYLFADILGCNQGLVDMIMEAIGGSTEDITKAVTKDTNESGVNISDIFSLLSSVDFGLIEKFLPLHEPELLPDGRMKFTNNIDIGEIIGSDVIESLTVEMFGEPIDEINGVLKTASISALGLLDMIDLSAAISFEFGALWPTSTIEDIISYYDDLTDEEKLDFDLNYKNNPSNPWFF